MNIVNIIRIMYSTVVIISILMLLYKGITSNIHVFYFVCRSLPFSQSSDLLLPSPSPTMCIRQFLLLQPTHQWLHRSPTLQQLLPSPTLPHWCTLLPHTTSPLSPTTPLLNTALPSPTPLQHQCTLPQRLSTLPQHLFTLPHPPSTQHPLPTLPTPLLQSLTPPFKPQLSTHLTAPLTLTHRPTPNTTGRNVKEFLIG